MAAVFRSAVVSQTSRSKVLQADRLTSWKRFTLLRLVSLRETQPRSSPKTSAIPLLTNVTSEVTFVSANEDKLPICNGCARSRRPGL